MPTQSTSLPPSPGMAASQPLRRTRDDRIVAGVCAGLARTLGAPVLAVRLITLAVAVAVTPLALIAYAGLAIAMPRDDGRALLGGQPEDRRETMVGVALIGAALIALMAGLHSSMLGGPGGIVILAIGIVLVVVHHQRRAAGPGEPVAPAEPDGPAARTVVMPAAARRSPVDLPYPGPRRPAPAAATAPTLTMPQAPRATPAAPAPREPSVGLYGLAAVVGASMIALMLGILGGFDASAHQVAVGLGIGAVALTAGAVVFARRRGAFVLIVLAGLLAIGAAGTAAVGDRIDEGVGERNQIVATAADLPLEHRLGIGSLTVDVSREALTARVSTLRARLGIGELVVTVPRGVGVVSVGPTSPQGIEGVNAAAGVAPEHTLRLDADVDIGDLRVETNHR